VRQMQAKAKAINPRLAFLPLMYFPEITPSFVTDYKDVVDGVVVAYPQDRDQIVHARALLNGEQSAMPGELSYPHSTPSQAGDFVSASIPVRVISPDRARLRFVERDDFTGPTAGYHFKQVIVDGAPVWDQDVAGGTNGWQIVDLDLSSAVVGKKNLMVSFRLYDKKGVSNFGVQWQIRELRGEGLRFAATNPLSTKWRVEKQGPFTAGFGPQPSKPRPGVHLPFIVMTAASADEFKLRHGNPSSPERIADWLRLCLQTWREGQCDGVVTYCLDKTPNSPTFPLARKLFLDFRSSGPGK